MWRYADQPSAIAGLMCSGPVVGVIEHAGEPAVRAATVAFLEPFRTHDGGTASRTSFAMSSALPWLSWPRPGRRRRESASGSSVRWRSFSVPAEAVQRPLRSTEFLFPRHASPPLHTHPQDETYSCSTGDSPYTRAQTASSSARAASAWYRRASPHVPGRQRHRPRDRAQHTGGHRAASSATARAGGRSRRSRHPTPRANARSASSRSSVPTGKSTSARRWRRATEARSQRPLIRAQRSRVSVGNRLQASTWSAIGLD